MSKPQSQESIIFVYLVSESGKKFSPPYLFQRIVNVWTLINCAKQVTLPRESGLFVAGLLGSASLRALKDSYSLLPVSKLWIIFLAGYKFKPHNGCFLPAVPSLCLCDQLLLGDQEPSANSPSYSPRSIPVLAFNPQRPVSCSGSKLKKNILEQSSYLIVNCRFLKQISHA